MSKLDLTRPPTRLQQLYPAPRPDLGINHGDCARTSLAMVLGMASPEDVPHFEKWSEQDAWLRARGAHFVYFPMPCKTPECLEEHLPTYLNGCPAVLQGTTAGGHPHGVAIIDDKMVDTVGWTTGYPLASPCEDGFFWVAVVAPCREPVQ